MRSYDVAAASLTIDAPTKWTDNLLSQHPLPDVISANRGVARRISRSGLLRIAIIRILNIELGVSLSVAVQLASKLIESGCGEVSVGDSLRLAVDRAAIERRIDLRLQEVLESAPTPRRGRPPGRRMSSP